MEGWIKLHRDVLNHWVFKDHEAWSIWCYCLLNASHEATQIRVKSRIICLYPGQLIFGRKQWSSILGIGEYKVYRTIQLFVEAEMVKVFSTKKYSVITICNWSAYQSIKPAHQNAQNSAQQNAQVESTSQDSLKGDDAQQNAQQMHNSCTHNKNDKNVKNILKDNSSKVFDEDSIPYRLALRLKELIIKNESGVKVPEDIQGWAKDMDKLVRIDKREPKLIYDVMEWCQKDGFWRSNILSARKLREKFDTLDIQRKGKNSIRTAASKPANAGNFKQRQYDDKFYDSLYENVEGK